MRQKGRGFVCNVYILAYQMFYESNYYYIQKKSEANKNELKDKSAKVEIMSKKKFLEICISQILTSS